MTVKLQHRSHPSSIRKSTFFWILVWMDDWTFNQIQLQKSKKVGFLTHVQCPKSNNVGFSIHVQCQKSKKVGFLDFLLDFCWIIGLDSIFFSSIQSNYPRLFNLWHWTWIKNPTLLDFWSWIWLDVLKKQRTFFLILDFTCVLSFYDWCLIYWHISSQNNYKMAQKHEFKIVGNKVK
jgi:hypothetical protein